MFAEVLILLELEAVVDVLGRTGALVQIVAIRADDTISRRVVGLAVLHVEEVAVCAVLGESVETLVALVLGLVVSLAVRGRMGEAFVLVLVESLGAGLAVFFRIKDAPGDVDFDASAVLLLKSIGTSLAVVRILGLQFLAVLDVD